MATYYKYKSREGKDIVDWRAITKGITDDITRIEGEREQQRVDIDNAVLTNLEDIANKPQGAYSKENDRISSYAEQASAIALANQKLLKSGAISLKEYNSRTNTGLSSTKKLFTLSKQYQDNYEAGMKRLQSIDGKPPVGSEIEAMLMGSVERFGPPGSTDYYIDPITGEAFLASTIEDGDPNTYENTKKIDGVNKSLMSVGTAEGIINRQVDRYQSDVQATRIAESLGTKIEVLQGSDPNIKTKEDAFARMFETKDGKTVLSEFGKAVNKSIEASMVTDMSKASMLIDTMGADGYYMYTKNDDGTFTDLRTNTRMDSIPDKNLGIEMFVDNSGAYQPRLTVDQEKAAIDGVRDMIRTKLDIKETARPDTRMTDAQKERAKLDWAKLGLEKKKFNKEDADEASDLNTKREVISTLYGGTREDINSALTYYKDYGGKNNIQKVDRSDSGITITYENEFGDIVTSDVSFYVPDETATTMMPNPNYDPNKEEDAVTNPKEIKGRLKTEAQFIQSASQLLIGESVAEGLDDTLPDGSLKYNRPFTSTPGMSVENAIIRSEGGEEDTSETFKISNSKYLGGILDNVNLMDEDTEVASEIPKLLEDLGVEASPVGSGATDEVLITIPGYNKSFTLETDFGLNAFLGIPAPNRKNKPGGTKAEQTKERMRFKEYLEAFLNTRPDISRKLNFEADPKKGKFNKYNKN